MNFSIFRTMKNVHLLSLIFCAVSMAQTGTEIYLFDLNLKGNSYNITNGRNISENDGYDNQPSFINDSVILYAGTRNNQTDIVKQHIPSNKKNWLTNTPKGSEYSPLMIPETHAISAIRLDENGKQLLYKHALNNNETSPITESLIIGYHVWYNKKTLISFVLGDPSKLVISNIKKQQHKVVDSSIGRSLHKIPNSNLVSYIKKNKKAWEIRSLNPKTGETSFIANTLVQSEDMVWTPNGTILMGKDDVLYQFNPKIDSQWKAITSLSSYHVNGISRLAINPSGTKLAVVVNESPITIVQQQLDAYNNRDITAFTATYSENIELYQFPDTLSSKGIEFLRSSYKQLFERVPNLHAKIKNRIVIGNKVIDEEEVTFGDRIVNAVAIYEVQHNKITKVTFIR